MRIIYRPKTQPVQRCPVCDGGLDLNDACRKSSFMLVEHVHCGTAGASVWVPVWEPPPLFWPAVAALCVILVLSFCFGYYL